MQQRLSVNLALGVILVFVVSCAGFSTGFEVAEESASTATLAIVQDGSILLWQDDGVMETLAEASPGERYYSMPVWSDSGWLSLLETEVINREELSFTLWAYPPDESGRQPVAQSERAVIYAAWAHSQCSEGACQALAFLEAGMRDLSLHVSRASESGAWVDETLTQAGQLYFDWSPLDQRLLAYSDSSRLALYDVETEGAEPRELATEAGRFAAPGWSPDGEWMLYAGLSEEGGRLLQSDGRATQSLGPEWMGEAAFDWSPDGRSVALLSGEPGARRLVLVDTRNAAVTEIETRAEVVAFYWSPGGDQIAIVISERGEEALEQAVRGALTRPSLQAHRVLQWLVYSLNTREVHEGPLFVPARQQALVLSYFDQFARSHRVWSPDGQRIVYAALQIDGSERVYLLNAADLAAEPLPVGEGGYAVFSYH